MVFINKKKSETQEEKDARKEKEANAAIGIQDEYQAKGFELVTWVQEHKGLVSSFIVAVIVLGAAFSGYNYYQKRKDEEASAAYFEAVKPLEEMADEKKKETMQNVQKSLAELVQKFPSSEISALAAIQAGFLAVENGEHEKALEFYSIALSKLSAKDDFYPLALMGNATALELNGKNQEALAGFEKIVNGDKNLPGRDLALLKAATLAKEDKDKANKYLSLLLEDYPESMFEKEAKKLQEMLK